MVENKIRVNLCYIIMNFFRVVKFMIRQILFVFYGINCNFNVKKFILGIIMSIGNNEIIIKVDSLVCSLRCRELYFSVILMDIVMYCDFDDVFIGLFFIIVSIKEFLRFSLFLYY